MPSDVSGEPDEPIVVNISRLFNYSGDDSEISLDVDDSGIALMPETAPDIPTDDALCIKTIHWGEHHKIHIDGAAGSMTARVFISENGEFSLAPTRSINDFICDQLGAIENHAWSYRNNDFGGTFDLNPRLESHYTSVISTEQLEEMAQTYANQTPEPTTTPGSLDLDQA